METQKLRSIKQSNIKCGEIKSILLWISYPKYQMYYTLLGNMFKIKQQHSFTFSLTATFYIVLLLQIQPTITQQTLIGRLFAGYQGWFGTPNDNSGVGWRHFKMHSDRPFAKDNCVIDFWPDTSEYEKKYQVNQFGDYYLFSPYDFSTVRTHFKWMHQNNIDGIFLQRFGSDIRDKNSAVYKASNKVLQNVLKSAKESGKLWSLMYDLSGMELGNIRSIIMQDWKYLNTFFPNFRSDASYIKHKGKPLVTIWGVGFNDHRKYTIQQCAELVDFLKNGQFGNNAVMLGVPRYWRQGGRDSVTGDDLNALHSVIGIADVVSPWAVGRYSTIAGAQNDARVNVKADLQWCNQKGLTLMPVIFPGFSWHNLQVSGQNPSNPGPYDQIPRKQNGTYFLQEQGKQVAAVGAKTIYVAMFDQMNQGTAIFKCTQKSPSLADGLKFVNYAESPDFYLKLAGTIRGYLKQNVENQQMI